MPTRELPEWERVLSAAAHLQKVLPGAVLVGGTAAAMHARHRFSADADHVLQDLRSRFDAVLGELESVAGWKTARINRPVQILGSLDGIETGVRQLIRTEPLETVVIEQDGRSITLPTEAEMLRIKAALILKRNATRDYLDFVALAERVGDDAVKALANLDSLYPQPGGQSALQQLQIQLSSAMPFDLEATNLAEYKLLAPTLQDWAVVKAACAGIAVSLFDTPPSTGE